MLQTDPKSFCLYAFMIDKYTPMKNIRVKGKCVI